MRECLHYRVSKNMLSNIEEMKLISSCASMLSSLKASLKWKLIAAYLKTFFKIRVRWHISGTKFGNTVSLFAEIFFIQYLTILVANLLTSSLS